MSDTPSVSGSSKHSHPWAWLVLSALVFGALMAFRRELYSIWLRALVAGIAFALLFPAVQGFRHKP
jgi:succinate dehydrogenase/fumarate reductase cytochrome b subunit